MRKLKLKLILLLPFLWLCVACQMSVHSDVTVFHQLPPDVYGKTYAFYPAPEQQGSLEYKTYEEDVRQQLFRWGFVEKPASAAELAVFMTYAVDGGKSVVTSSPEYAQQCVPVYNKKKGQTESYCSQTYVGSRTSSSVVYQHTLKLIMRNRAQFEKGKTVNVYEGTAVATEGSAQLNEILPYLIDALFTGFPGANGQTRSVNVPVKKERQYY